MNIFRNYLVDLLSYMPEHLTKDRETATLLLVESEEHNLQENWLQEIFKQFFVETATWGLALWENDLELKPSQTDDYTQRRNRIYLKLQGRQTVTKEFMKKLVKRYTSADSIVDIIEYSSKYSFKITIDGEGILYRNDLLDAIETYKPAHLAYLIELVTRLMDELELSEDRLWTIELAKKTKEYYPWRGRYFDSSWTFIPQVQFDGGWGFNGEYCFDGIPTGEEDDARLPFRFDGDWFFDECRRFGYPVSRKILWGTQETDELTVVPRSAIKEQYSVTLPFDVLSPFDTGWAFGARDGPQETAFSASVSPALSEGVSLQEAEETITVLRAVLRDIYPMPHILSFDSTWEFHAPICMDGTWDFDGNARQRFGDVRHEPWKNLPILFFDEQREAVISYEEIQLCFDGTWEFTRNGTRHFGDTIEIPRIEQTDGTPYDGRLYDGSWKFFGLHSAGVFWNEDAQERFALLEEEPEPEKLEAQETAAISAGAGFADAMFSSKVFDGAWEFRGMPTFGSSSAVFEGLPTFSGKQFFDALWAFGMCGRLFDGTWKLGEDSRHFDATWRFHGEEYFQEGGGKEASDIGLRSVLSDRLEHFRRFGKELFFDGKWSLGGITGPQETETPWQIATSMEEKEPLRDEARISVSVAFREHAPISPVPSFNGEWAFPETYMFDGAWQFGGGTVFGEAAREMSLPNGEKIFREKSVEEQLFVGEQPTATISDTMTRTNAFGEGLAFDGEWNFGEQEGFSESLGVLVSVGLRFDGTWSFDAEARVLDGAWSLGTDSYSFGENAEPRNRFDGTWNFTDSGTRIRFERRWNSFGIETIAA